MSLALMVGVTVAVGVGVMSLVGYLINRANR